MAEKVKRMNINVEVSLQLADAHREIDNLDLRGLPLVWTWIQRSPRALRWVVFKGQLHAARLAGRLAKIFRRRV